MTETVRRQIRGATLIWMGAVAASRVAGLLREVVVARAAGATGATDVFFSAFTLPDFINYLLAGGALSITIIPILTAFRQKDAEAEGWRVFSTVLTLLALGAILLLSLGMIFTGPLCRLLGKGFDGPQQVLLVRYTRILLPAQFCFFAGGLFGAAQMARGKHAIAALAPLLYNAGIITGGLLLGGRYGMEGFCWGALGGAILGPLSLQLIGAMRVGFRFRPNLDLSHPAIRQYLLLTLPIMIGQSILVTDDWLIRYFGAFLGTASISWLNYAKKLAQVLPALLGQASAAASFPTLSAQAERGAVREMSATLGEGLRRALLLSAAGAVLLLVLNREATVLLFRGHRFTTADALATGQALAILSLSVPAWVAQALLARGYYALRSTWAPTLMGTVMTLLGIPLYGALSQRGYLGLATASSIAITLYVVALHVGLQRRLRRDDPAVPPLLPAAWGLRAVGVVLITLLGAALTRGGVGQLWPDHAFGQALLRAGVVGVVTVGLFAGAAQVCGVARDAVLPGLIGRLFRRPAPRA